MSRCWSSVSDADTAGDRQAVDDAQLSAGHQSPFDPEEAHNSLRSTGRYDCAVNLWWFNLGSTPSPHLPIFARMVPDYEKEHWPNPLADPGYYPGQLTALLSSEDECDERSNWMCGSAIEPRCAAISACARAIRADADERCKLLRKMCSSHSLRRPEKE